MLFELVLNFYVCDGGRMDGCGSVGQFLAETTSQFLT